MGLQGSHLSERNDGSPEGIGAGRDQVVLPFKDSTVQFSLFTVQKTVDTRFINEADIVLYAALAKQAEQCKCSAAAEGELPVNS